MARIINLTPGSAHIEAKPRQIHNGPDIPEGTGDGAAETEGEGEETRTGREGGEGKEITNDDTPPSPEEELADIGRAMWQEKERRKRLETGTERPHGGGR